MLRKLIYSLPCILLSACADTSEKYRDTHHLELPPTLAIEHTNSVPNETDTETTSSKAATKKSILEGIEELTENDGKPILLIKTRLDRAWDMTEIALKLADIEVLDKNRNDLTFQVNYDPDDGGLLNLFNNRYDPADYRLTLKETIPGIEVSAKLAKPAEDDQDNDASAALIKQLHQVIQEKIIHRNDKRS